ncbi:MAG: hypothetical protein JXB00_10370 [Bacteroidales bacterium]|nr:hypothetical protein [Bacteroidales bacterium]
MKPFKLMCLLIIPITFSKLYAQENQPDKSDLLDLKLQLIDSKLELLDSKIQIWETKPQELEITLNKLDDKVRELQFNPEELNNRFRVMDSLISEYKKLAEEKDIIYREYSAQTFQDTTLEFIGRHRYAIALNPVRIFEGTMEISLEYRINDRNTFEISGMATYANSDGISNYYLKNQSLEYFNRDLNAYDPYTSDNLSGFGTTFQWKNYLLPSVNKRYYALKGLYASPYAMYRRIWITGLDMQFNEETDLWEEVEIVQKLNVLAGGVIVGWQFPIAKVLSLDVFIGGVIRLSHYDTESGFTKYKKWDNIDYSGVLPRAGIKIGILK